MELSVLLWPFWVTRVPHCQLSASNLGSVHKSTDVMDESIISNELGSNIFGNGLHRLICGGKHSENTWGCGTCSACSAFMLWASRHCFVQLNLGVTGGIRLKQPICHQCHWQQTLLNEDWQVTHSRMSPMGQSSCVCWQKSVCLEMPKLSARNKEIMACFSKSVYGWYQYLAHWAILFSLVGVVVPVSLNSCTTITSRQRVAKICNYIPVKKTMMKQRILFDVCSLWYCEVLVNHSLLVPTRVSVDKPPSRAFTK